MNTKHTPNAPRSLFLVPAIAFLATLMGLPVNAAVLIPDTPMQINNGVPPNILFVLDDSGSMADTFMPDSIPNTTPNPNIRLNTNALNTIYYSPTTTYRTWQQADGTFMPDTPYTAAFGDINLATGPIDLGNAADRDFYTPIVGITNLTDTRQYVRHRFHRNGDTMVGGAAITVSSCPWNPATNNFADPKATVTLCARNFLTFIWPGGITRTVAEEKQNFANWYSFHRSRIKVAKASASYAFNDTSVFNANSEFRVGYKTIHNRNNFLIPVGTSNGVFTGTNRSTWFTRLFGAQGSGNTPTNTALYDAGEYYTRADNAGPYGPQSTPSQYQCRQNFTILTTDGYRNQSGLPTVGNADGTNGPVIDRPDGASYQYTPTLPYSDSHSDTLADIAMHYWKRDLRTDTGMINIVPTSASNPAFWQHMVTFGISIGLGGTLNPDTALPGLTAGTTLWPAPANLQPSSIDDLWHATINGRGSFVVANNPTELAEGLGSALRAISERRGSGSNAAVASTSTAAGSKLFQAAFFSARWYGELQSFDVTSTGVAATPNWSATVPTGGRNILTHNGLSGTTFPTLAQTTALTPAIAAYVAGDRSQEDPAGPLRPRTSLLADIVNSSPVYNNTGTSETVYVGANGGMLHAFNALTGAERFAYVPAGINLTWLREFSEPTYGHRFFVDGPIVLSNRTHISNRTVLIGSLGRGGRGVFALDVTNPGSFGAGNVLWDRSGNLDADMGLVMGKPLIAKLNNGSVGVIVPNGVNSTNERAVLFVYDLLTGALIKKIDTNVGSATQSNGLAAPRGWDSDGNGTADLVYAGDLRGNVWKFDLSNSNTSQWKVANNRALYSSNTTPLQPITGGISVSIDPTTYKRWVFFGTGRLLSTSDLTDTAVQSWYGVIDDDTYTTTTNRTNLTARNIQSVDGLTNNRAFEPNAPLPLNRRGWYIDLDTPPSNTPEGERMVGEPQVLGNALVAASIIPSTTNPCFPGRGYINAVDAYTGTSLSTSLFDANRSGLFTDDTISGNAVGSVDLSIGMVTDPAILDKLLIASGSLGRTGNVPIRNPAAFGRISWREVIRN